SGLSLEKRSWPPPAGRTRAGDLDSGRQVAAEGRPGIFGGPHHAPRPTRSADPLCQGCCLVRNKSFISLWMEDRSTKRRLSVRSPFQLIAEKITQRPLAVAAIFFLIFCLDLYGMGQTTMETGRETYIDKSTPRGALLDNYMDTFKSDSVMRL